MMNRPSLLSTLIIVSVCAAAGCSGSDQAMLAAADAADDNRLPTAANDSAATDAPSPPVRSISIGQVVLANWAPDKFWYPAKVEKREAGTIVVRYYDQTVETLAEDRVVAESLKVGDRVYVDWRKRGRYYAATITARHGETLTVKYDDGTEETSKLEAIRLERQDRSGGPVWVASDPSSGGWSSQPYRPQVSRPPLFRPQPFDGGVRSGNSDRFEAAAEAEARDAAARAVRNYRSQTGGW